MGIVNVNMALIFKSGAIKPLHLLLDIYIISYRIMCVGWGVWGGVQQPRRPSGTPQTDDSAGLAEALTHVDVTWE